MGLLSVASSSSFPPFLAGLPKLPVRSVLAPRRAAAAAAAPSLDNLQTSARSADLAVVEANWLPEEDLHESWIHSGWMKTRKLVHASLIRTAQRPERCFRFRACGREAYVAVHKRDPNRVKLLANHCGDRLCQVCGGLRARRLQAALLCQLQETEDDLRAHKRSRPVTFCTLTLGGNTSDLSRTIDRLYASFKRLRKTPLWRAAVGGGAAFLEVHWSERSQRWHPHLHLILRAKYMDQRALAQAWHAATGDSYIVDIRRVANASGACRYVAKYASKPLDHSFIDNPALLDEAVLALKGRRLCLTFGDWYGTPLNRALADPLVDEQLNADNWTCLGTLASVRTRASSGDPEALRALACLRPRGSQNGAGVLRMGTG